MIGSLQQTASRALLAGVLIFGVAAAGCGEDRDGGGDAGPTEFDAADGVADAGPTDDATDGGGDDVEPDDDVEEDTVVEDTGDDIGGDDAGDTAGETGTNDADAGPADLTLTSVTPPRGPVEGGTEFVIDGAGFTEETVVYFGSRKADANLVDGQLIGRTPEASGPGAVPVKVLDPLTGQSVLEDAYTYTTTLRLDGVQPDRVPVEGGTEVTLEGRGFTQETRVSFDGETALQHEFVDAQTLRVVTPAQENPGAVDVRLTNRDETTRVKDGVFYFEELAIDSVRPAAGPTGGGTTVTLKGSGFESGMTVDFGQTAGTVQSVDSGGTEATVTTPSHSAGLVSIAVETSDGNAAIRPDAFYYRGSSSEFTVESVDPAIAPESGQIDVTLVGAGLDASGLSVEFGGASGTVQDQGEGWAVVEVPSHAPGTVDVAVADGSGNSATLTDGFEYVADLWVDQVDPAQGDASGGTEVTIRGQGFQGVERVSFGGVAASFSVDSNSKLTATAPAHAPGTFDVVVDRGDVDARLEDGFTYTEPLEVWGFSPVRGSMAGGTYVEIRGRGFTGDLEVDFGDNAGKAVEAVDAQTLAVRTPGHRPAAVDVTVKRDDGSSVTANEQYTYFNPGASSGGAWGGPIQGAVNVSVYSQGGEPLQGAFVMLSTNAETTYKGRADENGLVTLSGPDVYGEQTITAAAPGYSSTTVQHVNAENITIFLSPTSSGSGAPPPGPPTATFEGRLTGLDKIAEPGPDEYHMAVVYTTRKNPWSQLPDAGGENVVTEDGPYKLKSRIGDLALVAVGGLYDSEEQRLKPLLMGVKRFQFAAEGKTYERDIELNIQLNNEMTFKLKNPPMRAGGPDINQVQPYVDFGFEGVFGRLGVARGTSNVIATDRMPNLTGKLSDVSFMAIGGSYTNFDGQTGPPQSVSIKRSITDTSSVITMPSLLGVPHVTTPAPGAKPPNNLIEFDLGASNRPDFFWVRILTLRNRTMWDAFVPGSASSVQLPDFPDFSHLPEKQRPAPYPGGTFRLMIIGIEHPGVSYRNFGYDDLSYDKWNAFSIEAQTISF